MASNIFTVKNLSFSYGKQQVLNGLDFSLHEGRSTTLIGANGCGKSTLFNLMTKNLKPDQGEVFLREENIANLRLKDFAREAAIVHQYNTAPPDLTVEKLVSYGRTPYHTMGLSSDPQKDEEKIQRALEITHTSKHKDKPVTELSGGQKQRVAMARMLAAEPELILLDEPFSALDTYLKWQLEQEMYKHLKEAGKPVIFVSHNRDEVYRLCDTVSCMNRGKMEVMEPLKEFFQNPKTRTAAILSGCKNISAAERVDAHTLRAVDWGVTLHVKEREIADDIRAVGIRAHFLATVERPGEENVFPVNESEIWEDPFEWNISFRKNAECSWLQWKIAKTDWSPEMGIPKELYLKEEDILLLTDS